MGTSVVRVREAAKASEHCSTPSFDSGKLRPHVLFYAILVTTVLGISVEARPFLTLMALTVQVSLIFLFVKSTVFQRI